MSDTETLNRPTTEQAPAPKADGSSCSTDKAMKTDAEKSSCSTEHKSGGCSSKG